MRSRCQQGGLLIICVEEAVLCLFLASGSMLEFFGFPWLIEASPQSLPSSSHDDTLVCTCESNSPLFKDTCLEVLKTLTPSLTLHLTHAKEMTSLVATCSRPPGG